MEKISLCGDDCLCCPRYLAKTDEECAKVAELWYRVGWRDHIISNTEIKCRQLCNDEEYHMLERSFFN